MVSCDGSPKKNCSSQKNSSRPYFFLPAILGPEKAAPMLWAPGKMHSFCRFYFYGRGEFFLIFLRRKLARANLRSKIASDCDCDRLVHSALGTWDSF